MGQNIQTMFKIPVGINSLNKRVTQLPSGYWRFREWQERAANHLADSERIFISSPPGSGKTFAMCGITDIIQRQNKNTRAIFIIPSDVIAKGFREAKIQFPDGSKCDWTISHDFCAVKQNGIIDKAIKWLESPILPGPDSRMICTYAAWVGVFKKLEEENKLYLLNDALYWFDEAHHVKIQESSSDFKMMNVVGSSINYLLNNATNAKVGLVTATPFRGDRNSLLTPEQMETFDKYVNPWDDHLAAMKHLKEFEFKTVLGGTDWADSVKRVIKARKCKDIVYLPYANSSASNDKYAEAEEILKVYGKSKVVNLVDEADRDRKKEYLEGEKRRLRAICALNMAKEGFDWPAVERVIVVGSRNLTEMIQILGRILREYAGKKYVEVVLVLPFALDQSSDTFTDDLSGYYKAILASLLCENILYPMRSLRQRPESNEGSGESCGIGYLEESGLTEENQLKLQEKLTDELIYINRENKSVTKLREEYIEAALDIIDEFNITENQEEIALQVWAMIARRSITQQDGYSVDEIDFEMLLTVDPIDGILTYTSGLCGVNTLNKLRESLGKTNEVRKKKEELLEMAKKGDKRPITKKHPLGGPLISYTNKRNDCYDSNFDKEIRSLRPDWFENSANKKKEELLNMARNGNERPMAKKHPLGESLIRYTNKSSNCYDDNFANKIKKLQPDWFENSANKKKEELLNMARNGNERPMAKKCSLARVLCFYTNKNNACYDPIFDKEIRKLRPDWFISQSDKVKEKKIKLLKMAKEGKNRPNQKNNPLGYVFSDYIKKNKKGGSSYDPVFDKEIRKLRPDWFITQTEVAKQKKEELLKMAKIGKSKPHYKNHLLVHVFNAYTNKSSSSYDPVFDKEIRKLRPDWFFTPAEKANENKKKIIRIAKNGKSKPHYKTHNLGSFLYQYTNKSSSSYDPVFDKEIRKLRPDWFITQTEVAKQKKEELLKMAKNGKDKPDGKNEVQRRNISNYTNKNNVCYDPVFDKEIRKLRPDWFISQSDKVKEKKIKLLKMAKEGDKRPTLRGHEMGSCLISYTTKSSTCYDPIFYKQIRGLRSDWF
jgi:superfamily II DNA or RNA helicase/chorismate mutase